MHLLKFPKHYWTKKLEFLSYFFENINFESASCICPGAAPVQLWGSPRADAHFQIFMCPGAAPGQIEEKS